MLKRIWLQRAIQVNSDITFGQDKMHYLYEYVRIDPFLVTKAYNVFIVHTDWKTKLAQTGGKNPHWY